MFDLLLMLAMVGSSYLLILTGWFKKYFIKRLQENQMNNDRFKL